MSGLTHFDAEGRALMVDVSEKAVTSRTASACAHVVMRPETLAHVIEGKAKKGDVLGVARLAGIMAAITLLGVPGNADLEAYKTGGAISASFITSIIAAGYAGGDFLEGIIKSHLKPSQG